jgi:hypothetical protein
MEQKFSPSGTSSGGDNVSLMTSLDQIFQKGCYEVAVWSMDSRTLDPIITKSANGQNVTMWAT